MGRQLVSVVIPTWNQQPERLAAAIASVRVNGDGIELIVVDDGSDVPVPGALRIGHAGISAALNAGIKASAGDWICWLSSDDEMDPDKVGVQLASTIAADARCSFHSYRVNVEGKGITTEIRAKRWRDGGSQRLDLQASCPINGSTTMIHRSVFDTVGLYDTTLLYGQDWDMWCRIGCRYRWLGIRQVLGTRHDWNGNLTNKIARGSDRSRRDAEDQRIREAYADPCLWRA